jgi:hypothetical protein
MMINQGVLVHKSERIVGTKLWDCITSECVSSTIVKMRTPWHRVRDGGTL